MTSFLISLALVVSVQILYHLWNPKRRIYCNDEGWKSVDSFPYDKKGLFDQVLITDGEDVRMVTTRWADHDRNGNITMGVPSRRVIAWRKVPYPPKDSASLNDQSGGK